MQAQLNKILEEAKEQLQQAASVSDVDEIRVKLLGKKGKLTEILRGMGKLSPEERKTTGQMANSVRSEIEGLLERRFADMKGRSQGSEVQTGEDRCHGTGERSYPGRKTSTDYNHRRNLESIYEHGIFDRGRAGSGNCVQQL